MTTNRWERCNEQERAQLRGFARGIAEVEWLLLVVILVYLFVAQPVLANPFVVFGALGVFVLAGLVLRYTPRFPPSARWLYRKDRSTPSGKKSKPCRAGWQWSFQRLGLT